MECTRNESVDDRSRSLESRGGGRADMPAACRKRGHRSTGHSLSPRSPVICCPAHSRTRTGTPFTPTLHYTTLHRCACTCHHLLPHRNAPQTYIFFTGVELVESLRFWTCELVFQNVMVMIISVLHLRYPVGGEGEGLQISKI